MSFIEAEHPRGHASNPGSFSDKEQGKPELAPLSPALNDERHTHLAGEPVTDKPGSKIDIDGAVGVELDLGDEPIVGVDDLLDQAIGSSIIHLAEYVGPPQPESDLVLKISRGDDDEKDRLVDEATDDERQALATHPSADIRHLVARSPATDVDTLSILLDDKDENVAAAAEHSLN